MSLSKQIPLYVLPKNPNTWVASFEGPLTVRHQSKTGGVKFPHDGDFVTRHPMEYYQQLTQAA